MVYHNSQIVHRLLNPLSFAAGQLAVFQGASEVPISVSRVERATRKNSQLTCGPEGCVENGSAASLLVSHVSI
jgi:hypothetical protein